MIDPKKITLQTLLQHLYGFSLYALSMAKYFGASRLLPLQAEKKMNRISFCTTVMNRLDHLKQTLPRNIRDNSEYPNIEFVVLNYNSTDELDFWIETEMAGYLESGVLKYHTWRDECGAYRPAHSKNTSHLLATGDIVCNLDADAFTGRNFAFYINHAVNTNPKILGRVDTGFWKKNLFGKVWKWYSGSSGRLFLTKDNFLKLGGYDERMKGYGCEDNDFVFRALASGLSEWKIPIGYARTLRHSTELRVKNLVGATSIDPKLTPFEIEQLMIQTNLRIQFENHRRFQK